MAFNDIVAKAQTYFPKLQVKYKDQSTFMKILGKIMFFNPNFMTKYTTTLGNTVYLPSEQYAQNTQQGMSGVFIHECVHMYDEKRLGLLFQIAYALPQLLSPIMLLLLFFLSWKIVLPLVLLFLLPIPSPGRAYLEKHAYFVQIYVEYTLYQFDPQEEGLAYSSWFKNGSYYWMWPFEQDASWTQEAINIKAGKPSCASDPDLFKMVNDLIAAAKV